MTAYVCCICMKSLDDKVIWEDTSSSHGNSELANHSGTASDITYTLTNVESDELIFSSHFRETRRYGAKRARKEVSANRFAIVSPPCGHLYHLGCICTWMENLQKRGWYSLISPRVQNHAQGWICYYSVTQLVLIAAMLYVMPLNLSTFTQLVPNYLLMKTPTRRQAALASTNGEEKVELIRELFSRWFTTRT